jgi:hypothetical protein
MRDPVNATRWPDLMKPSTAAAMVDVSESTWRAIWPVLAAHHGLRVVGLAGPKFRRDNVLAVIDRLRERGLNIAVDKGRGIVRIGADEFPVGSSRSGCSGRGRPRKGA